MDGRDRALVIEFVGESKSGCRLRDLDRDPVARALNSREEGGKRRPALGQRQNAEAIDGGVEERDFRDVIRRIGHAIHPTNACLEVNVVNSKVSPATLSSPADLAR
jgi:hypothetical protein